MVLWQKAKKSHFTLQKTCMPNKMQKSNLNFMALSAEGKKVCVEEIDFSLKTWKKIWRDFLKWWKKIWRDFFTPNFSPPNFYSTKFLPPVQCHRFRAGMFFFENLIFFQKNSNFARFEKLKLSIGLKLSEKHKKQVFAEKKMTPRCPNFSIFKKKHVFWRFFLKNTVFVFLKNNKKNVSYESVFMNT